MIEIDLEFKSHKEELLEKYITKDFMISFQNEMIRQFKFPSNYLLGDDLFHSSCSGTYEVLKYVCDQYQAQEIIEFLDEIIWYEYDDFMDELCYSCARRYGLYTPKRRWKNIWKAERLWIAKVFNNC